MNKPEGVNQAIIAIWATLFLSCIVALVNKWIGDISMGEFTFTLIFYSLFVIIPYKINNGSNSARYIYLILVVLTTFLFLAEGRGGLNQLDFILMILLFPVEIFIVYRLFQAESSSWFLRKNAPTETI